MEKSFSDTFLIAVGSLITLTLFFILSKMRVEHIYSKLNGGSWRTSKYLHLISSSFCFFKISKKNTGIG